jgi:hypothetical protein
MNRRVSSGSSNGPWIQDSEQRAGEDLAPDEPMGQQWFIRRYQDSQQKVCGYEVLSTGWSDDASVQSVGAIVSAELQELSEVEGTGRTDA